MCVILTKLAVLYTLEIRASMARMLYFSLVIIDKNVTQVKRYIGKNHKI